ncbi:MAG: purine-nucleoside phosphorylase [Kiritimatiellaeota bacterium]|nr:purine-nucleoside phosphorylase [Kiritimatiellota bacterium]
MNLAILAQGTQAVRTAFPTAKPVVGLILGSGWCAAATVFETQGRLDYYAIPGLGRPTVAGHDGALLWGTCSGLETFVFLGRRHWYEGAGWEPVAFPIYLLKAFGASLVVLTNAAGGIRADLTPGTLMVIDDHINAMGAHPLVGPHDPGWGTRFPDLTQVYDADLRRRMARAAERLGQPLAHGVYLATSGPTYETPAEIRAFRAWGADAVGMSTVPEALLAHATGLRVGALSFIANRVAGLGDRPLAHEEITAAAYSAAPAMTRLLQELWKELAEGRRTDD